MFEDKPTTETDLETCIFAIQRWNDSEQRNYMLHTCTNPENTGGKAGRNLGRGQDHHGSNTYSCWYKNESMTYRCWGLREKIAKCPLISDEEKIKNG